jgi:hypothetical protein
VRDGLAESKHENEPALADLGCHTSFAFPHEILISVLPVLGLDSPVRCQLLLVDTAFGQGGHL